MWITRARLLVATLWVGSLWAIGYLAAPTLFITLYDRVMAGTVAGSLFRSEAWLSVACAVVLFALQKMQIRQERQDRYMPSGEGQGVRLIMAMLACTVVGYFCLQPYMAGLREAAGPSGVMASDVKLQFGILHGAASGIYLIQSLLGVALILKIR